jgi:hypothetical protein
LPILLSSHRSFLCQRWVPLVCDQSQNAHGEECMLWIIRSAPAVVSAVCFSGALAQDWRSHRSQFSQADLGSVPACEASREGTAACLAGRQCICRFDRGGIMTGRADGYRWNCGLLNSSCAEAPADAAQPALQASPYPLNISPDLEGAGLTPGTGELGERSWR